ncbi:MAG: hypothetical protein AAGA89_15975 [Pseudomonadota bacterium]
MTEAQDLVHRVWTLVISAVNAGDIEPAQNEDSLIWWAKGGKPDGDNVETEPDEFDVLTRPSMSRNSTLLGMIVGLEEITSGSIHDESTAKDDALPKANKGPITPVVIERFLTGNLTCASAMAVTPNRPDPLNKPPPRPVRCASQALLRKSGFLAARRLSMPKDELNTE